MFTFGLLCFTSFFTLINPLGAMPVFMTMTMELDEKERRKVARRASLVSFLIMMFFAISGDLLFRFFGISIDSLRIVGGIIFLIMGMDMLQARLVKTKVKESEVKSYVNDISITPLSIPMLCGPGAITNAIVMWNKATDWETKMIMVIAVAVVITLVYHHSYGDDHNHFGHRRSCGDYFGISYFKKFLPDYQDTRRNRQ